MAGTLGLLLGVHVPPASTPKSAGAQALLARVLPWFIWLRLLWVDGGSTGTAFAAWLRDFRSKLAFTVVKRPDRASGFTVLARRWVVERTFGWLTRHRRVVRDYENSNTTAEALELLAMIRIQIRSLA